MVIINTSGDGNLCNLLAFESGLTTADLNSLLVSFTVKLSNSIVRILKKRCLKVLLLII